MDDMVIEVRHLTRSFGPVRAVDDITFSVRQGSTTALLGGNGAGKTTTLAMLLGLLLPSRGSIRLLGEDMLRHRYRVLPRMNFTSPYVDLPYRLTVRENLMVYARLYGLRRVAARIRQLAEELDLAPLLGRAHGTLSAGQKTRAALAKSLLNEPELLLLDEPTASMDPDTADRLRDYLKAYQRRTGATLMLASHNMPEVEQIGDDVIMLRRGRVIAQAPPQTLIARYGRETLEQVFLDIARERERPVAEGTPR